MPMLDSEALYWIDYEPRTKRLRAIFRENDRAYAYLRVPQKRYDDLLAAASPGGYFNTEVKPRFNVEEIDRDAPGLPPRQMKNAA
jgi:hypothetical protein